MRHSFEAHSSLPNFSFTCGVHGCPQVFTSLSGMVSHICRKHRGVDMDEAHSAHISFTGEEQNSSNEAVVENMDFMITESLNEEYLPELKANRLERSAALFLISLKEWYELTQTAVDFAVSQVQQMVKYAVEDIKESVEKHLLSHLEASGLQVDLPDIGEYFNSPDPFSNLQSEHMQTKYYRENFDLVVSCL